jgi:hypothetical protein
MIFLCHHCCASRRLLQVPHRLPLLPAVIGSLPLPLLLVPHQLDGLLAALSSTSCLQWARCVACMAIKGQRLTEAAAASGAGWLLGDPRKPRGLQGVRTGCLASIVRCQGLSSRVTRRGRCMQLRAFFSGAARLDHAQIGPSTLHFAVRSPSHPHKIDGCHGALPAPPGAPPGGHPRRRGRR